METKAVSRWKQIFQFIVLCFGGNIGYVVYMRSAYYDAYLEAFTMTNQEFGVLFSVYGTMTIFAYFFGGVIADKFSARKLMSFSLVSTGLLNIWFGTFPSYKIALLIYALMGITTTLTFWSALMKVTRQFGRSINGESTAFGGLEGGRAISQMLIGTLLAFIFGRFVSMSTGLRTIIFMYGGLLILLGVLTWMIFKGDSEDETASETSLQLLKECIKNPSIWLMAFMVMGCYSAGSTMSGYASKVAISGFGATAAAAAYIGLFDSYFKPFGAFAGGVLGDKFGSSKALMISVGAVAVSCIIIAVFSGSGTGLVFFMIVFALAMVFNGAMRGQYFAPIKEAKISMAISGTAIGLISTIGYLPDVFISPIVGSILDNNEPNVALKYLYLMLAGFAVFAVIMAFLFRLINKKNIQELSEERKLAKAAK